MRPTSQHIRNQINEIDKRAGELQRNVAALSFDAVAGDKDAAAAIARANTEIAGLTQDRAVLSTALGRAETLERFDRDDEAEAKRLAHLAAARENAAAALKAAQAMDSAIAGFIAASTALEAAESATRQHVRLAIRWTTRSSWQPTPSLGIFKACWTARNSSKLPMPLIDARERHHLSSFFRTPRSSCSGPPLVGATM